MTRLAAIITAILFAGCCLAAWAAVPQREPLRDSVATVEVNKLYDEQGRLVFTQLMWLDEGNVIIAWRLVKADSMLPQRDRVRGDYVCIWHDGEALREVRAKYLKETWTQCFDPEVEQRWIVPKEARRELTVVRLSPHGKGAK